APIPSTLVLTGISPASPSPSPRRPSLAGQPASLAPPALLARAQAAAFSFSPSDVEWAKAHGQGAPHHFAAPCRPDLTPGELTVFLLQMAFALVVSAGGPDKQVGAPWPEL